MTRQSADANVDDLLLSTSPSSSSSSLVSSLLGKSKSDARATVGKELRGGEKGKPTSTKSFQNGNIEYENYEDIGLSLEYLNERVDCVHVYNETKTEFTSFRGGALPFGIDFEKDTAKDVVRKLGEPTSKGGTGVQIFIVYEMLGIKISFNANDWEQAGASIHSMAVWKASDEK
jgi:hypothetical protein